MKKILVALLLSVVAVNAFGMEAAKIAKYQCKLEMLKLTNESKIILQKMSDAYDLARTDHIGETLKTITYVAGGAAVVAAVCLAGCEMWNRYLIHSERNKQNSHAADSSQKSNWGAYGKIAAGVGLTGLSAYLGMNQTPTPMSVNQNEAYVSGLNLAPMAIALNLSSAYTLAPMVPAYFFLKSGFKDLETK